MTKPHILLLGEIDHAKGEWNALSDIGELIEPKARSRQEFIEECKSGRFDNVVAAYRTFTSGLKFIAHNGAGYDQIDVHACFNTSMMALRAGHWKGSPAPPLGHDPQGKVLGILGMGGIGRNLQKKAAAFGMVSQYHNRTKLSDELSGGAKYVSFDELLATSDVISLNLPLNKNTRHIISTEEFKKMKKGVVIINTARGAVMNEDALVKALESGQVWSAGLDVFEEEPKVHQGLINNPHVMLVPHMGTWTIETQTKMEIWCIDNVRSAIEQGKLMSPVGEQKDM
ncbi:hypothetical protein DID88_001316 [Monilinia fructigena]|uniref:D-isomer specific 2-hydroxyacid dehydrogenase NAD-binding domain-containing protein n=1 Tax=Monilinia fructigena TaxID=38457 RepID=A0A395IY75_9HELO|nr:hypothetical protein DID88_001316 [Monilinia fructigena]